MPDDVDLHHPDGHRSPDGHPYRFSRRLAEPAPPPVIGPSLSKLSRLATFFLVTLIIIGAWLAMLAWRERRLTRAVHALPEDVQAATFRRAYDELATTCATHPELADHCADEAEFVLRFPQCTAECQTLARRYFPTVTK